MTDLAISIIGVGSIEDSWELLGSCCIPRSTLLPLLRDSGRPSTEVFCFMLFMEDEEMGTIIGDAARLE